MTAAGPMTNEQIDELRTRLTSPGLSADELREIALNLLNDRDAQYTEADYWREGYRLAKGLSDEEINAMTAVRDAFQVHPQPCWFPHKRCVCEHNQDLF